MVLGLKILGHLGSEEHGAWWTVGPGTGGPRRNPNSSSPSCVALSKSVHFSLPQFPLCVSW